MYARGNESAVKEGRGRGGQTGRDGQDMARGMKLHYSLMLVADHELFISCFNIDYHSRTQYKCASTSTVSVSFNAFPPV